MYRKKSRATRRYKDVQRKCNAKRVYGEFWESLVLLMEIDREIIRMVPNRHDRKKMRLGMLFIDSQPRG